MNIVRFLLHHDVLLCVFIIKCFLLTTDYWLYLSVSSLYFIFLIIIISNNNNNNNNNNLIITTATAVVNCYIIIIIIIRRRIRTILHTTSKSNSNSNSNTNYYTIVTCRSLREGASWLHDAGARTLHPARGFNIQGHHPCIIQPAARSPTMRNHTSDPKKCLRLRFKINKQRRKHVY
jgi:hypothetical protein